MKNWMEARFSVLLVLAMLSASAGVASADSVKSAAELEGDFRQAELAWKEGDAVTAMRLLEPIAESGHAGAQGLLGFLHDAADNDVLAAKLYQKAYDQGDLDAGFSLGSLYVQGDGVEKSESRARELFLSVAQKGHRQGIIVISQAYANKLLGFGEADVQSPEALEWLKKAADLDHIESLERLAAAYETGAYGLPKDSVQSAALIAKINDLRGIDPDAGKNRRKARLR